MFSRFLQAAWGLCWGVGFFFSHAYAENFENFKAFESTLVQQVEQQLPVTPNEKIVIKILQINPNLPLPSCAGAIQYTLSRNQLSENSNTLNLRCNTAPIWQFYVPVQIQHIIPVLAASRMLKPGEIISASDIMTKEQDKSLLYDDYFQDVVLVEGMAASRVIPEGTPFGHRNVKKMPLIFKNQTVKLSVRHGAILVSMQGIALSNGYLHESIKILNPVSKKTVFAEVTGSNMAEIKY